MAVTKKPMLKKNLNSTKKLQNTGTDVNTSKKTYFGRYSVSHEIDEGGEFLAEIKEHIVTDTKDFITMTPYRYEHGAKVYFETVYLNLELVSNPSSVSGQFISLFKEARNWGDIIDRVVGIKVKLVKGKQNDGEEPKVFKNITKVFETDEDELVFDDAHQAHPSSGKKPRAIDKIVEADDDVEVGEAFEEEDDAEVEESSKAHFSDEIFDEDDFDDDFEEDEE